MKPVPETNLLEPKRLPLAVGIAAVYLILLGAGQLGSLLVRMGRPDPTLGRLVSLFAVKLILGGIYLVAAFGLFRRKAWSRRFALGALMVAAYYFVKKGALLLIWGHSLSLVIATVGALLVFAIVLCVLLVRWPTSDVLS